MLIPYEEIANVKPPDPKPAYLTGTTWKYVGMVDVVTGAVSEFNKYPKECKECYTLTFIADDTVKFQMIEHIEKFDLWEHIILSNYYVHYSNICGNTCGTDIATDEHYEGIGYVGDFNILCDLYRIKSYIATNEELKIYTRNSESHYLLFKPIK